MNGLSVFIADDSPAVRATVRGALARSPDLRVVGEAADGRSAIEGVERLCPDVLLLDLSLPELDGFAALERLNRGRSVPTVILASSFDPTSPRSALEALRAGAVDLLPRPQDSAGWRHLARQLPDLLRAAATAQRRVPHERPEPPPEPGAAGAPLPRFQQTVPWQWLALGGSTGGPAALHDLLIELPAPAPARVAIVQHIARGLEPELAAWLAGSLGLDVRVARHGEQMERGDVRIAPTDSHFRIAADGRVALDDETPQRNGHRPSVDELFQSLVALAPPATAAAVLTGMGSDGADGLLALRRAGALCLAQDEASSAVFGMPGAAFARGGAEQALSPSAIGRELARRMLPSKGRKDGLEG